MCSNRFLLLLRTDVSLPISINIQLRVASSYRLSNGTHPLLGWCVNGMWSRALTHAVDFQNSRIKKVCITNKSILPIYVARHYKISL